MDNMNVFLQVIVPILGGAVGGYSKVLYITMKHVKKLPTKLQVKYTVLGAIAGFVGVNLLNPKGDFGQVATLSVLAGINALSFLMKNSLAEDGLEKQLEEQIFDIRKTQALLKTHIVEKEVTPEELESFINEGYNEVAGGEEGDTNTERGVEKEKV